MPKRSAELIVNIHSMQKRLIETCLEFVSNDQYAICVQFKRLGSLCLRNKQKMTCYYILLTRIE